MASLIDLPDDLLRCILDRCTTRSLACLAATCRTMRDMSGAVDPLPPVVLTGRQVPRVMRWLWNPDIAARVHVLIARHCLYGSCRWTAQMPALETLVLTFCRVSSDAVSFLPTTLRHLDIHQVVPPSASSHSRMHFGRFKHLQTLNLVFMTSRWDAAFIRKLPRGLRRFHARGPPALVIESRIPSGIRDVSLHAVGMLLIPNRLPNGVRRVCLACDQGRLWLGDTVPWRPRKMRELRVMCPYVTCVPRLYAMTRLETLHLACDSFIVNWKSMSDLQHLRDVELRVKTWLGFINRQWPASVPMPARLVLSVADRAVSNMYITTTTQPPTDQNLPPDELGSQDGDHLGPDA